MLNQRNLTSALLMLFVTVFTANCGADNSSKDPNKGDKDGSATIVPQVKVDSAKDSSNYTYSQLVDTLADLPVCDDTHERQLVYVVETSEFEACSKTVWTIVDIKGKDGANGKDGSNGKDGAAGKDGQVVNANMWFDPVMKKYWLLPTTGSVYKQDICIKGWKTPAYIDLLPAITRGLAYAATLINAPKDSYVKDPGLDQINHFSVRSDGADMGNYCIQE